MSIKMIWPYCIWSALQYDWQKVFVKDMDLRKRNLSHSFHIDFIKVNIRQSKNHCICITERCSEEWDFTVYILYWLGSIRLDTLKSQIQMICILILTCRNIALSKNRTQRNFELLQQCQLFSSNQPYCQNLTTLMSWTWCPW